MREKAQPDVQPPITGMSSKAEKIGDREVKFTFDSPGNRELPHIVGELLVLPKHYWEGTDSQGRKRDISQTTLEPPLGSGPYRIKEFVAGRSCCSNGSRTIGANFAVQVGHNNFDELRFEFFRDNIVALRGLQGGSAGLDRRERSAKQWSTAYDFPAVARKARGQGRVSGSSDSGRMQAFVLQFAPRSNSRT